MQFLFLALLLFAPKPKDKLPEVYAHWLNQEVVYIITPQEKKEFLALTTDESRDKFMADFWETRNPVRGAKPNVFKDEHYARLEYANATFGRKSNTPGWMTDMGRAYIQFGKPDTRAPYTGYGQIYPLELWFYSNKTGNPAYPAFFYLLFFMPEDVGEYKLYRPYLDGPMKLVRSYHVQSNADVYKFLRPLSGELARAAFTLIPGEPMDTTDYSVSMGSDMLVTRVQNYSSDPFYVKMINQQRALRATVHSTLFLQDARPLEIATIPLTDPTGRSWLDFSVTIPSEEYGTWDAAHKNFNLSVGYKLKTSRGDVIVEDEENRAYPAALPFQVANRVPLVPGSYRLEIEIVNRTSSRTFKGERSIEISTPSKPGVNGPLVTARAEQVSAPKATVPFQYFGAQFVPGTEVPANGSFRVLYQVESATAQDYQMELLLVHPTDRSHRVAFTDDIAAAEFRNGTTIRSKSFAITELAPGDYRLISNLRVAGKPEVIWSKNQVVHVAANPGAVPLYFAANSEKIGAAGVAAYIRGLESLALDDSASAARYLAESIQQNRSNAYAVQLLVQSYYRNRSFSEISALYKSLGIDPFSGNPETLAQVAVSLVRTGDGPIAREVLQSAQQQYPNNPFLTSVAQQLR